MSRTTTTPHLRTRRVCAQTVALVLVVAATANAALPKPGLIQPRDDAADSAERNLIVRDSISADRGAPRRAPARPAQAPSVEPQSVQAEAQTQTEFVQVQPAPSCPVPEPLALEDDRFHIERAFESAIDGTPRPLLAQGDIDLAAQVVPEIPSEPAPEDVPAPLVAGNGDGIAQMLPDGRTIFYTPSPKAPRYFQQILPAGLLYKSYLAGEKEPRMALQTLHQSGRGNIWEVALGGRVGIWRYGTEGAIRPEGWQIDIEGAAFPRLDLQAQEDVDAIDYRFGIPISYRRGPWAYKFGYAHLSSHLADEFMLKHPTFPRVNYVRDAMVFGTSYDPTPDYRVYGEVAYGFHNSGGAKPFELQCGAEYSPAKPGGAPFAAVNGHVRQNFQWDPSINIEAGWQWRGEITNHLLRVGLQYYGGKSMQYEFFNRTEHLAGFGVWFDY